MRFLPLSDEETLRYNRQIILNGFDFCGQERLKASLALIVGLGGLGCAASQYLAAAGLGTLALLDFDTVSLSNLQRQVLHHDERLGSSKVISARDSLAQINPHIKLDTYQFHADDERLQQLVATADVILDCTDNVAIRNHLNRVCFQQHKPLVSGAAIRMEGQISVFTYQDNEPCYRCLSRLFGDNILSCVEAGVMSPLVGIIGSIQAMESIKLLTQFGHIPRGKVILYDALSSQWRTLQLNKDPSCEVCGGCQ